MLTMEKESVVSLCTKNWDSVRGSACCPKAFQHTIVIVSFHLDCVLNVFTQLPKVERETEAKYICKGLVHAQESQRFMMKSFV